MFVAFAGKNNQNTSEKYQKFEKIQVRSTGVRRNFSMGGQARYFAYPFHAADDAMQRYVNKTLCPFYTIMKMPPVTQGRNEGGKGGTIHRAPYQYGGAKSLRGRHKVPTVSQILSSKQYICFRKTSGSNMAKPASCPGRHLTSLHPCCYRSSRKNRAS